MDKSCCKTLSHNRPEWALINDKIENIESKFIKQSSGLKIREASLLIGGPPCQPFSKSGYWVNGDAKRLDDPRANTLHEYLRVLEDFLPEAFILENVFGLAYKGKDEGLEFLRTSIAEINKRKKVKYSFNWQVLNAANFGVPQIRERVFIVGSRNGINFKFPEPRFFNPLKVGQDGSVDLFTTKLDPYRTAWDAIGDLDEVKTMSMKSKVGGKWGELLPTIPPGENYLWHTERGGGHPLFKWRSRYWNFLLKLHPERPSWTIQAQPGTAVGPFHWNNRRLTMREMARLQTFPDDVEILGGSSNVQKQIGNAVPSVIGELLGKEIRKQFYEQKVSSIDLKLLPPKRDIKKKIKFIKNLPKEYRDISL